MDSNATTDAGAQTKATVIFSAPQAWGKTRLKKQLQQEFVCQHVVDDWSPGHCTVEGALHLTNTPPGEIDPGYLLTAVLVSRGWEGGATTTAQQAPAQSLGNIPTLLPGEHYAGILLDEKGTPTHHLVLLTATQDTRLTWQAAMDWAASVGGALPTRQEQALLYTNCKPHLQLEWHWSCEEYSASCAWLCDFYYGYQLYRHKSYEGSVVAVRRLPIGPSIL